MLWQLRIEYTLRTNQNNEAPKKQWKIPAIQALLAPPFELFQSRTTTNVDSPQPPSQHRARRFRTRFRSGRSTPQTPSLRPEGHGKRIEKVKWPQEGMPSVYQSASADHSRKEHVTIRPKSRPHSDSILAEYGSSSETVTDSMVISMMSTELSTPLFGSAQAYRRGILCPSHPSQHPHFHRHCSRHRRYNSTDTRVHWANNDDRHPQTPFPSAAVVALLKSLSQLSARTRDVLIELAAALDSYTLLLDRVDTLQAQFIRHHHHLPPVIRQRIDTLLAASDAILTSGAEAIELAVGGSLVLSSIRAETVVLEVRRRKKSEGLHELWAAGQPKKPKKEKRYGVTSVGEVVRVGSDEKGIEEARGRRDERMQLVVGTYDVRAYDRVGMQGEGALLWVLLFLTDFFLTKCLCVCRR